MSSVWVGGGISQVRRTSEIALQIKSNQVGNVHLKEKKNWQEAIYPTIFYNQ